MRHKYNVGDKVTYTFRIAREQSETITAEIERVLIFNFSKIGYKIRDGEWTCLVRESKLELVEWK